MWANTLLGVNNHPQRIEPPNRYTPKFSQALFEELNGRDSCLSIKTSIICAHGPHCQTRLKRLWRRESLLFRSYTWSTVGSNIQHNNIEYIYSTTSLDFVWSDSAIRSRSSLLQQSIYRSSSCQAQPPSLHSIYFSTTPNYLQTFKMRFAAIITLFAFLAGQAIAGKWLHQYRVHLNLDAALVYVEFEHS